MRALFRTVPFLWAAMASAQPYLNLDFETSSSGFVCCWLYNGLGYDLGLDTSVAFSGAQSFRLRAVSPVYTEAWVAQWLPIDMVRGRHVRLSGYLKTQGVTAGHAGLEIYVYSNGNLVSVDRAPSTTRNGTTAWQQFAVDRDVSPDATEVLVEGFLHGEGTDTYPTGTAWFDNFAVEVDGVPFPEGPPPATCPPGPEQLAWLQATANPFSTPDAGNGFDDLQPVKHMVGNARVVGLGEGTHGTSEFFRMKHRLLEYLATEMGFTIFAIEANMPEAYLLNDYVLNGNGDPVQLLKGMYFWTWNTQEVLDMILWMRQFNLSGKGPLQFTGFDMQYSLVAIPNVENFVAQVEPAYYATVWNMYTQAAQINQRYLNGSSQSAAVVQPVVDAVHGIWQHLSNNRSLYLQTLPAHDVDWAIQNAVIVEQATTIAIAPYLYRDYCMATNVGWILGQNPGAKAVLWAHNAHVWRAPGAMGWYLTATHGQANSGPVAGRMGPARKVSPRHGAGYVVFGQFFHSGRYNAYDLGWLGPNDAKPSFPGTLEWFFHSTGIPRLMLDMRYAQTNDPGAAWLFGPTLSRFIGAVADDGGFNYTYRSDQLTAYYDVAIFFDQTTRSALLPF